MQDIVRQKLQRVDTFAIKVLKNLKEMFGKEKVFIIYKDLIPKDHAISYKDLKSIFDNYDLMLLFIVGPSVVGWISNTLNQLCGGYFLRNELIEKWGLSDIESQVITICPSLAEVMLPELGYKRIFTGLAQGNKYPDILSPDQKVILFNRKGKPIHCFSISNKQEDNGKIKKEWLIDQKLGKSYTSMKTWRATILLYELSEVGNLTFSVYKKVS